MLIDLLTYFRLDKAALISALGFSKTVINPEIAIICRGFSYCMACRGSAVRVRLAPLDYWVTRNNKWFVLVACS